MAHSYWVLSGRGPIGALMLDARCESALRMQASGYRMTLGVFGRRLGSLCRITARLIAFGVCVTSFVGVSPCAAQNGWQDGRCIGPIRHKYIDAPIGSVQITEQRYIGSGWATNVMVPGRSPFGTFAPGVHGLHASNMYSALNDLEEKEYYTVDITLYLAGGWIIEGNRNRAKERRAAIERENLQRQMQQKQEGQWEYLGRSGGDSRNGRDRQDPNVSREQEDAESYAGMNRYSNECPGGGRCDWLDIVNRHQLRDIVVTFSVCIRSGRGYNCCTYRYRFGPGETYRAIDGLDTQYDVSITQAWFYNEATDRNGTYGRLGCN